MRKLRSPKGADLRASEQPQPFKSSSIVRQFGGTDGEISNNSSDHASVTQVLSLLNGYEVNAVIDKKGSLAKEIKLAKSAEERLDILFLSIYSRYPTDEEKEKFLTYTEKKSDITALAKAMLNSKSFLFVQ